MEQKLYNWLQKQFYQDNHNKYRKYFEEWINNILPSQINGFREQMYRQENKTNVVNT